MESQRSKFKLLTDDPLPASDPSLAPVSESTLTNECENMMLSLHHAHTHYSLWQISIDGLDKLKKSSDLKILEESSQPNQANKLNILLDLVVGGGGAFLPASQQLPFPTVIEEVAHLGIKLNSRFPHTGTGCTPPPPLLSLPLFLRRYENS